MPELTNVWKQIWMVHQDLSRLEAEEQDARRRFTPDDEMLRDIEMDISSRRREASARGKTVLANLERYPDRHYGIERYLSEFHTLGTFDQSVFIMTKYPDGESDLDRGLASVVSSVKTAIASCGMVPRLASDRRYHERLWTNVQIYMLGCRRGIAIMEDRYRPELNPNVAMEWGWMTGMGRSVLYLRERAFDHARADWDGLLHDVFDWDDPGPRVSDAVTRFLRTAP